MWFRRKSPAPAASPGREASLAMRPVRNARVAEEPLGGELVRLVYPASVKPWFADLALRLGLWNGAPLTRRIELDELGSFCWRLIDGVRSAGDVADVLAERYGLPRREAELAVAAFLRELGRRGLIGIARAARGGEGEQ